MGGHRRASELNAIRSEFDTLAREMNLSRHVVQWYIDTAAANQIEAVNMLLSKESELRSENRCGRLLKRAKFPAMRSIEGFDFDGIVFHDSCSKERMLELDFIGNAENLVFFGKSGRGKTHLATALGIQATQKGMETRWWSTADLVRALGMAKKTGDPGKIIKDVTKADLVILDEFGYIPFDVDGSRLLFQILSGCYENTSIIFTTNLQFSQWGSVFGDRELARAAIDRIIHHGHLVKFEGPDRRMQDSPMYRGKCDSPKELNRSLDDTSSAPIHPVMGSVQIDASWSGGDLPMQTEHAASTN